MIAETRSTHNDLPNETSDTMTNPRTKGRLAGVLPVVQTLFTSEGTIDVPGMERELNWVEPRTIRRRINRSNVDPTTCLMHQTGLMNGRVVHEQGTSTGELLYESCFSLCAPLKGSL